MVRMGLVGMGFMGQQHLAIHQSLRNVELVAVCDDNPDKVAEVVPAVGGNIGDATELDLSAQTRYVCVEDMLDNEQLDCVDVCVPTYRHADVAVAALEAGCHCIVEKPMGRSLEDCDRMISAAEATGGKLFIGQCIRFWPEYEVLAKMVSNGDLGRVASARFTRLSPTPIWSEGGSILDTQLSGGALMDLHIHDADFILALFGRPQAVMTRANNVFSTGEKVDHVFTTYFYHDLICTAEGGWAMPQSVPFEMGFQVLGDKGLLELSLAKDPPLTFYPADGEPYSPEPAEQTGYEREIAYFVDCIENDRPPQRVTPQSAREAVELVLAEHQSAQSGQVVAFG